MQIYINQDGKFEYIKEVWFKLEKEMQNLTEKNILEVFWIEYITSEFQLNNLRLDTVAFDKETNAFVIIEFKRWSSYSVIDQGFSYLSLLLNNKADFILLLQEKTQKNYKKNDIDWSQTRVIFVADWFTRYQQESINFKDLPIELWEMKQFSNNNIVYNSIKAASTSESIKTITKLEGSTKEIGTEIKTYILDDLIKTQWIETRELFEDLREYMFTLDSNLQEKINKQYIGYKNRFQNFIGVWMYKSGIGITLVSIHKEDIKDPLNKIENIPEERWWGKKSKVFIKNKQDLLYVQDILQQAYQRYKNL